MIAYPLSFAAGLLTSLSPCVLPALPFVVGSAAHRHRLGPVAMAGGLVVSFLAVGLLVASIGDALGIADELVRRAAASLMIIAGLVLLNERLQLLLSRWMAPVATRADGASRAAGEGTGLAGQFFGGALLGAVWSPCVGPTLGAAAGLAAQTDTMAQAAVMMLFFGIGAASPLLFAAYASQRLFLRYRTAMMKRSQTGKKVLGIALLVVGFAVIAGVDKWIESGILQILPDWWVDLTTRY